MDMLTLVNVCFLAVLPLVIGTSNADFQSCNPACNLNLVESIPENLTYPENSPVHLSTYNAWMTLLETAAQSVDIASYYWTLRGHGNIKDVTDKQGWNVYNGLAGLAKRGVKLRIVQNPPSSEYPDLDSLELAKDGLATVQNINFTKLEGDGILHTKMWVVDGKHFYVGSANMDWRSLTQVKEMGLVGMDCECLAQDAQRLFEIYWYLSGPGAVVPDNWPSSYTAIFNMENPANININGSATEAYWASSPTPFCASDRTHDLDALLRVINTAKKFVYIAVMDYFPAVIYERPKYYWPLFDDALRSASYDRGVHVRVMGSYWNNTNRDMVHFLESLAANNDTGYDHGIIETSLFVVPPLTTKSIPYTRVNHNKYMVSDNAAYVSTSNWSGDYFLFTGGVSCIVNQTDTFQHDNHGNKRQSGSDIRDELVQVFERDWYSDYNTLLKGRWER